MFHRRKDRGIPGPEVCDHFVVHRLVRIEAVDRIKIAGKMPGAVERGELVFQRERGKLLLHLFPAGTLRHISGMQRNGKIVQVEEIAA